MAGSTVAGVAAGSLLMLGCASYAENRRLGDALERAEQAVSDDQDRIAELEWRLRELEADRRRATSRELRVVIDKLEALTVETRRVAESAAPGGAAARSESLPGGADAKLMLRYWADRLRTNSMDCSGGLSPEQNSALNVILREERWLDLKDPWPGF